MLHVLLSSDSVPGSFFAGNRIVCVKRVSFPYYTAVCNNMQAIEIIDLHDYFSRVAAGSPGRCWQATNQMVSSQCGVRRRYRICHFIAHRRLERIKAV